MNRKRDLENIGLIYEGYAGINPENIGVSTSSGAQKKAVKGLLRRGYEIHDEYTRKAGGSEIVLVKGENLIKNLGDSEEIVGVDAQGNINGQPYQSYLSDIEEDEQSSAYGQELADEAEDQNPLQNYEDEENIQEWVAPLVAAGGAAARMAAPVAKMGAQLVGKGAQAAANVAKPLVQKAANVAKPIAQKAAGMVQQGVQKVGNVAQQGMQKAGQAAQRGIQSGAAQATKAMMQDPTMLMQLAAQEQQQQPAMQQPVMQQQQPAMQQPAMQQQPVYQSNEEENIEGKEVSFTNAPSLDDIKAGHGVKTYKGKVLKDLGNTVLIDLGNSYAEISKDELDIGDEDAEDLGPNQQPEDWGDEAMGDEQPGETSARFSQDTPDDPASGGGRDIDNPDEEEYDDPYYNREEDLRSRGIDPDAEDPDADEKGKEERNHENEEVKKESFNSHGDRDMSLLAEKYLNIKRDE